MNIEWFWLRCVCYDSTVNMMRQIKFSMPYNLLCFNYNRIQFVWRQSAIMLYYDFFPTLFRSSLIGIFILYCLKLSDVMEIVTLYLTDNRLIGNLHEYCGGFCSVFGVIYKYSEVLRWTLKTLAIGDKISKSTHFMKPKLSKKLNWNFTAISSLILSYEM